MTYVEVVSAAQLLHLHSLISPFVDCCVDSLMATHGIFNVFQILVSLCSLAGWLETFMVANLED